MRTQLIVALLLLTPVAGCLELKDNNSTSTHRTQAPFKATGTPPASRGQMTGTEKKQESTALCPPGNVGTGGDFCATRTYWIDGDLSLGSLPIDLRTFTGHVASKGGVAGQWNLTAVLSARGTSVQDAQTNLGNIEFSWSHEQSGGHFLKAAAKKTVQNSNHGESASMDLVIPASVLVTLTEFSSSGDASASGVRGDAINLGSSSGSVLLQSAEAGQATLQSSSGNVEAKTVSADTLNMQSSSGMVTAEATANNVTLQSSSGNVNAKLRPTHSGSFALSSSSGSVSLSVPEDKDHGYSVDATTSSGTVQIGLKDGSSSGSGKTKHFETNNYSGRTARIGAKLQSSSGNVDVNPL